jgi:hypothetical protein
MVPTYGMGSDSQKEVIFKDRSCSRRFRSVNGTRTPLLPADAVILWRANALVEPSMTSMALAELVNFHSLDCWFALGRDSEG